MLPRRTVQLLLAALALAGTAAAAPVLLSETSAQADPTPTPTESVMALLSVELTLPKTAKAGAVVSATAKIKTLDERPARNVLLRTGTMTYASVSRSCTQTLDGACRLGDLDQSGIQVPLSLTIAKTAKGKKLTLVVAVRGTGTAITKVSKVLTVTAPAKTKPSASATVTVSPSSSVSPSPVVAPPPAPVTTLPATAYPSTTSAAQTPVVAASVFPVISATPDPSSLQSSPPLGVAGMSPTFPSTTTQPAELKSANGPLAGDNLMLVVHTAWLTALMVCVLILAFKINRRRKRVLTAALQHGTFPEPDPPFFQRIAGSSAPSGIIAICIVLPATGLLIVAQHQDLAIYLIAAAIAIPQATRAVQQWRENMRTGTRPGQPPELDASIDPEDAMTPSEANPSYTAKVRITRL